MAERRVFPAGQGRAQDREKESGGSFVAGLPVLGEATDDRRE